MGSSSTRESGLFARLQLKLAPLLECRLTRCTLWYPPQFALIPIYSVCNPLYSDHTMNLSRRHAIYSVILSTEATATFTFLPSWHVSMITNPYLMTEQKHLPSWHDAICARRPHMLQLQQYTSLPIVKCRIQDGANFPEGII